MSVDNQAETLKITLENNGFHDVYSNGPNCLIWNQSDEINVTILFYPNDDIPQIYISLDDTSMQDKVTKKIKKFGLVNALTWLRDELDINYAPGFNLDNDNDDSSSDLPLDDLLPELEHDPERALTITTWETSAKKGKPIDSQYNVNAAVLCSNKKGLNLKQMDGRNEEIQRRIVRAKTFETLLCATVNKIEQDNLNNISINCAKGKHRSVSFAEILAKYYYPNSTVIHPNLK